MVIRGANLPIFRVSDDSSVADAILKGSIMNHSRLQEAAVAPRPKSAVRRLAERGLTTVEYAVGLLCAAVLVLTLFRIFSDNSFFKTLYDWLLDIFRTAIS